MSNTFQALGLRPELIQALHESLYVHPTDIQRLTIPSLLQGHDLLGQAQTGTGKTAAFSLPLLQRLQSQGQQPQALILAPTRELARQVADSVWRYGKHLAVRVASIYGGQSYSRQIARLERGVDVVVGTPGRIIDLMDKGLLNLSAIHTLVLDEADEMLKMGFVEDVEKILAATPSQRQTVLFSATLPKPIQELAARYMNQPRFIRAGDPEVTVQQIRQQLLWVHPDSKVQALSRLLETEALDRALIFTRTRARAAEVSLALQQRGYGVDVISGDLSQEARETVLRRFRQGDLTLLVATDVVARGVDIPSVSHVFNLDLPTDPQDYVHRIGRTGRAGRSGVAISLATPDERRRVRTLEHFIQQRLHEMELPKLEAIRLRRNAVFFSKLQQTLDDNAMELGLEMVSELLAAGYDMTEVAAAAIQLARAAELARPIDHVKSVKELMETRKERYQERPEYSQERSHSRRDDHKRPYDKRHQSQKRQQTRREPIRPS